MPPVVASWVLKQRAEVLNIHDRLQNLGRLWLCSFSLHHLGLHHPTSDNFFPGYPPIPHEWYKRKCFPMNGKAWLILTFFFRKSHPLPSLKLTASFPLKIGWLEYDPFLLGYPIFSGELVVSGRVPSFIHPTPDVFWPSLHFFLSVSFLKLLSVLQWPHWLSLQQKPILNASDLNSSLLMRWLPTPKTNMAMENHNEIHLQTVVYPLSC